jgi:cytochrome c biogenesis protein CcdA/thiol-disulfide isomerase/thioredoxin
VDVFVATVFAVLAGAGTALSPCVLPVLPVALAAGSTGGRRRPLGVAVGLAATFALAAVLLTRLLDALHLPGDLARGVAIAVLVAFGIALVVPRLGAAVEGRLSRLARRGPAGASGDGFGSGLVLGASLGLVYAPCAGPILAAVVALNAAVSAERLLLGFAYGAGAALALLAVMTLGRRITGVLGPRSGRLQQGMGALMIAVAAFLAAGLDRDFQSALATDLPAALIDPARGLERSGAVQRTLARPARAGDGGFERAPELADTQAWFNSRPLTIRGLRGRVVLLDFWTYSCINCLRTLPHLRALDAAYRRAGLTIIGVHTPEFPFERDAGNVRAAIAANHVRYPVVQDNEYGTWDAYRNQYWPASYLIDARGRIRYEHFGEGGEAELEGLIRGLLYQAGRPAERWARDPHAPTPSPDTTTPETYLGAARAQGFANGPIRLGEQDYGTGPATLRDDAFGFAGRWTIAPDHAVAGTGARLEASVGARRVFLVAGSPDRERSIRVLLDGRPLPDRLAGGDVHRGAARIGAQRLYRLVDLPRVERHRLTLELDPGIAGYAFTFG